MNKTEKLTLPEALATGQLRKFARQHKISDPHPDGAARFEAVLNAMAEKRADRTGSAQADSGGCERYSNSFTYFSRCFPET